MDEWRLENIKRRLSDTAHRRNVPATSIFSLKLRPLRKGEAGFEQAYFGGGEYSRLDRSGSRVAEFEQHETGPEWLVVAANAASVIGAVAGIVGGWTGLLTYLATRNKDEPRGTDCDKLRIEVRRFDQSGILKEEIVATIEISEKLPMDLPQRVAEAVKSIDQVA